MYVTSTEIKNNLGKYLKICKTENIIITKNGKKHALLLSYPGNESVLSVGESTLVYGTNPKQKQFITYEEFLEITEHSDHRYELIDGRIYILASPGYTHQDILGRLYIHFWQYGKNHETCGPFLSPFDIELFRQPIRAQRELTEDDTNVVQPDLIVLCDYKKDIDRRIDIREPLPWLLKYCPNPREARIR